MRIYLFTLLTYIAYIVSIRQEKQAPPVQSQEVKSEPVKISIPEQRERQAQEQLIQAHLPEQRERQSQSQEVQAEAGPGTITPTHMISPSCKIAGCFNELCLHETENFNRTCNYRFREEFNCYKNSNCLLMENGSCDWERTTTLETCLKNIRRPRRTEPFRCVTSGCNNEICIEESLAPINTSCTYKPEYDCLRYTSCIRRGNRCLFERNRDFFSCLFNIRRTSRREEAGDEFDRDEY